MNIGTSVRQGNAKMSLTESECYKITAYTVIRQIYNSVRASTDVSALLYPVLLPSYVLIIALAGIQVSGLKCDLYW